MDLDIFCKIIDNYGDIGFIWRFAKEYQKWCPKNKIRVFLNNLQTLKEMHPAINLNRPIQKIDNITYIFYTNKKISNIKTLTPAPLIIEAYGCNIPKIYLNRAISKSKLLINLEYLSAETWVNSYHLKESPINTTKKTSLKKFFFMPGFSRESGGILIEKNPHKTYKLWKKNRIQFLSSLLSNYRIDFPLPKNSILGTLFSYEHHFEELLTALNQLEKKVYLIILGTKSQKSFNNLKKRHPCIKITDNHFQFQNTHLLFSPFLKHLEYDQLLHNADFNFVRGEDSFVRAILAAKPFIWDIYPMKQNQHLIKLNAFLDVLTPYFSNKNLSKNYQELSILYNQTKTISKNPKKNKNKLIKKYLFFFENLSEISYDTKYFKNFLIKKCDLMKNFIAFTTQNA